MPKRALRVAVLALPQATASTVFGFHDLFSSVGRDWGLLVEGRAGRPGIDSKIVARSERGFRANNGVWIRPDLPLVRRRSFDLVVVPDLAIAPSEPFEQAVEAERSWLVRQYAGGAVVAAACSGALLLGAAGLLEDADATTHWAYCDALRERCPSARVHPSRIVVQSGEAGRIVTAGGGFSWIDLAIHLVARFFGEEEAMRQARIHLVDWHDKQQLPFAVLARKRQTHDGVIAEHQDWLAAHYRDASPVEGLVRWSPLSERTLKRRFRTATGMSPIEYVQLVRLEDAKQRLETSGDSVESIAMDVGYEDASFFRRLFRRRVGIAPSAYRRKFAGMRESLGESLGESAGDGGAVRGAG